MPWGGLLKYLFQPKSISTLALPLAFVLKTSRMFCWHLYLPNSGGVDDEGKGAVYHYDAIGSFERVPYTTSGSGSSLVMSVLDAQIAKENQTIDTPALDKAGIVELCKDVLSSVGERDIHTGDYGEIFLIDAAGVSKTEFDLKLDWSVWAIIRSSADVDACIPNFGTLPDHAGIYFRIISKGYLCNTLTWVNYNLDMFREFLHFPFQASTAIGQKAHFHQIIGSAFEQSSDEENGSLRIAARCTTLAVLWHTYMRIMQLKIASCEPENCKVLFLSWATSPSPIYII